MTPSTSTPPPELLSSKGNEGLVLDRLFLAMAMGLTLLIAGLFVWEYRQIQASAVRMAKIDSSSSFNKDLVYRRWASGHGGVYVPITPSTPPNPYLEHIPERDISTPSGKKLTLMNPAYMTRQVLELANEQYGARGHITSLKPIRPENAPDPWETKALQAFEAGVNEVFSVETMNGSPYVRLMRPMIAEAKCLKCHSQQGYKLNDIRGGLSVTVPLAPYLRAARAESPPVYWGLALSWALGLGSLWFTKSRMRRAILIRQQAEEGLRASETRYRNFFENNYSVMLVIDPESGTIVDANPAATRFYGWGVEELRRKKIADINPASPAEIAEEMAKAKSEARNYFIFQHQLADGTIRDVEVYSGPLQTAERVLLFSIVHDVTERRRADLALRASQERYRQAVENSPSPIFSIDRPGTILTWNASCRRAFQYDEAEIIGQPLSLILWDDAQRNAIEASLTGIWQGNSIENLEVAYRRRDNSQGIALSRLYPVFDLSGSPQSCVFANTDITARKQAEDEVRRSLAEKEVLLKEIHHRVKNNMQVIYSLLNLQAKGIEDDAIRAMFEESRNRVNSMALIHEKLYRSKDFTQVNFKEYLQSLVAGLADTYRRPDIVCEVDMTPMALDVNSGIPCGLIVNELVSNSMKHAFPNGKAGTIRIGITKNSLGLNVLTVHDNGIGFPAGTDFQNTTSLGLQLVTVLTGQLHGTMELVPDQGTHFRITFPGSKL